MFSTFIKKIFRQLNISTKKNPKPSPRVERERDCNRMEEVILLILVLIMVQVNCSISHDSNGYIVYCPCMGRFGNQADQFLGSLSFAKTINRTLILPPWIEYIPYQSGSIQVPFNNYFNIKQLQKYHRVIPMESFMQHLASSIWPSHKRIVFCYSERHHGKGCDAKDGNPFGPFWDKFNIDFIDSEIFGPNLHFTGNVHSKKRDWSKYNGHDWPVLAFVGPPSLFPIEKENVHLQKYLKWSDDIEERSNDFIESFLPKGPFIGIHLRNGLDWTRACEHVTEGGNLFSSVQCTGYYNEFGKLNKDQCLPSLSIVIANIKRGIESLNNNITSIFVASDDNHYLPQLSSALYPLPIYNLPISSPHMDLAILGKSYLFIGNCVSSFTAFVKRHRDSQGIPTIFWGFPTNNNNKDEL